MSIFPRIEKITRDLTISHFSLMFGYKLFSLYFPLYLVSRGFSLPEVGYIYLLVYLPIAIFSPVVGFLSYTINPAVLATLGILGYAFYALGMILIFDPVLFYFLQILLGISAALFFVSARTILISSSPESYSRAFGWFYSAPFYTDAIAPAFGALFIWKFDFLGVFIFSSLLQVLTAIFCFTRLKTVRIGSQDHSLGFQKIKKNYQKSFEIISRRDIFPLVLVSFSVLILAGFYRTFFVLFLKDELLWSENLILFFVPLSSLLFLPVSIFVIKKLGERRNEKNIFQGGLTAGIFSVLFGVLMPVLNFFSVLLIDLGRLTGSLVCNSSRSGIVSRRLKKSPEEAGAIDTVFSPLGVALGALISGILINFFSYQLLFIFAGSFVIGIAILASNIGVKKF